MRPAHSVALEVRSYLGCKGASFAQATRHVPTAIVHFLGEGRKEEGRAARRRRRRAFAARVQKKIRPHCNLCDSLRWVQLGCTHFHCSLCIAPQRTHTTPRGHVGREEAILGEGKAAPEFAQLGLSGNEKKKGRAAIHAPPFHPPVHPERVQMVQADNELLPAASIFPSYPSHPGCV